MSVRRPGQKARQKKSAARGASPGRQRGWNGRTVWIAAGAAVLAVVLQQAGSHVVALTKDLSPAAVSVSAEAARRWQGVLSLVGLHHGLPATFDTSRGMGSSSSSASLAASSKPVPVPQQKITAAAPIAERSDVADPIGHAIRFAESTPIPRAPLPTPSKTSDLTADMPVPRQKPDNTPGRTPDHLPAAAIPGYRDIPQTIRTANLHPLGFARRNPRFTLAGPTQLHAYPFTTATIVEVVAANDTVVLLSGNGVWKRVKAETSGHIGWIQAPVWAAALSRGEGRLDTLSTAAIRPSP